MREFFKRYENFYKLILFFVFMGKGVHVLNSEDFDDFISEGIVLIDFYADWCGPCLMMGPIIDEVADKFEGKIKFGKINVDGNELLAAKYEVSSIPNFTIFKDGEVVEQFVGGRTADDMIEILEGFL